MILPKQKNWFSHKDKFSPLKKIGRKVRLLRGIRIEYTENLAIGDDTKINVNCLINAAGGVDIDMDVLIRAYAVVYSLNYNY